LQLVKKFPAFHGTRRFITTLTSVRHLSLSWASPIQSIYPNPTSCRSILILFTHIRLGLPSGLFPSGLPTKNLYTPLSSHIRATCPAHLILLYFITRTIYIYIIHIKINSYIYRKKNYWILDNYIGYPEIFHGLSESTQAYNTIIPARLGHQHFPSKSHQIHQLRVVPCPTADISLCLIK